MQAGSNTVTAVHSEIQIVLWWKEMWASEISKVKNRNFISDS